MRVIITITALVLVAAGVYSSQKNKVASYSQTDSKKQVLAESDQEAEDEEMDLDQDLEVSEEDETED